MELESNANPHVGSGVRDAAQMIESAGLLEQPQEGSPPVEQAPAKATPEAPQAEGEPEQEPEAAEVEAVEAESAETDPQEPEQELPDTLDGLAEAVGLSAEEFADHVSTTVTVNGETKTVTLAEARKGYQLEADYRQKTAAIAEERRQFDGNVQAATQEWQNRFQSLSTLTEQLEQAVIGDADNLDRILNEEGSDAYLAAKAQVDKKKELLGHAQAEKERAGQEAMGQQEQARQTYVAEQKNLLVQALPDFGDPEKAQKLGARIQTYLSAEGFSEQEVSGLVDHRLLVQARKAMLWDELQKKDPAKAKRLKGLPKVLKPGAMPEKGDVKRDRTAAKVHQLKKSGTRRDLAKVLEDFV